MCLTLDEEGGAAVRTMTPSSHILAVLCICAGALAAGCDSPITPSEDQFEPPAPAFLLGGSPLIILINDPTELSIEVRVEVTRGLTLPKPNDVFLLRMSLSFSPGSVGQVDPKDFAVSQAKDEGLRGSGTVSIGACIEIPADVWTKLQAADAADGAGNPTATVTVQLVLVDGTGTEHVLDTKTDTGSIDPNGDG